MGESVSHSARAAAANGRSRSSSSMEAKGPPPRPFVGCCTLCLLLLASSSPFSVSGEASDAEALLAVKASMDTANALPWSRSSAGGVCRWVGVKECSAGGRVTKLVLEFLNLTGSLQKRTLASSLDQLRVLSLKSNALVGEIPDLSGLINLKSLFLGDNHFTGRISPSIAALHRLKVVVLSGNMLSGEIPASLTRLPRLYALLLQDNRLTGQIPAFEQATLSYFNVSGNLLSGEVPRTLALRQFTASAFEGNEGLCGKPLETPCRGGGVLAPAPSLSPGTFVIVSSYINPPASSNRRRRRRVATIVGASVGAFLFLAVCLGLLAAFFLPSWRRRPVVSEVNDRASTAGAGSKPAPAEMGGEEVGASEGPSGAHAGGAAVGDGAFSWEGEGLGKLVFCGGVDEMYSLEELLQASAESLGRGTVGSTYKAVMESGLIVTVKRLKASFRPAANDDFRRRMEALGRLRHPNLVSLRAYFLAKEESLLVYDYFPNGSIFSLIHGSRSNGGGKSLHWTSCLKIAEDVVTGLLHLHQAFGVVHGNLKSSNILLGSDFESCLTDYGLVPHFGVPDSHGNSNGGASSRFDGAPETRNLLRTFTQKSDVYSFGILLLELLTGKTPIRGLLEEPEEDIRHWVQSVREEETESGDEPTSGNEASEEKLGALVNVAMACISTLPENRPTTKEVLRMIRDVRADTLASSNSSDRSPARWSDAVQSLPRDYGSEHSRFAERD